MIIFGSYVVILASVVNLVVVLLVAPYKVNSMFLHPEVLETLPASTGRKHEHEKTPTHTTICSARWQFPVKRFKLQQLC